MKNREGLGVTHEERRREGLARLTAIRACEGKVLHGAGLLRPVRAVPPTSGFCSQVVPLAYGIHRECFFFFAVLVYFKRRAPVEEAQQPSSTSSSIAIFHSHLPAIYFLSLSSPSNRGHEAGELFFKCRGDCWLFADVLG